MYVCSNFCNSTWWHFFFFGKNLQELIGLWMNKKQQITETRKGFGHFHYHIGKLLSCLLGIKHLTGVLIFFLYSCIVNVKWHVCSFHDCLDQVIPIVLNKGNSNSNIWYPWNSFIKSIASPWKSVFDAPSPLRNWYIGISCIVYVVLFNCTNSDRTWMKS